MPRSLVRSPDAGIAAAGASERKYNGPVRAGSQTRQSERAAAAVLAETPSTHLFFSEPLEAAVGAHELAAAAASAGTAAAEEEPAPAAALLVRYESSSASSCTRSGLGPRPAANLQARQREEGAQGEYSSVNSAGQGADRAKAASTARARGIKSACGSSPGCKQLQPRKIREIMFNICTSVHPHENSPHRHRSLGCHNVPKPCKQTRRAAGAATHLYASSS
jgi:hypothetical protein